MDIFDILTLIGGLALFLFGMNIMGQALERRAGDKLSAVLSRLTSKKSAGFLTGLGITAVIQSSSATTVMVVGFVNSGLMVLKQAINVIMGANVGTTVTAWVLSLSGIDSSNTFVKLLKPTSFTPVLALIGIIFYMFSKNDKRRDTGTILLGFATLMFGMDTMSGAVKGLADLEGFRNLFIMFKNPVLGLLAGAVLTGVIQSSSASVGILQALALTGQVSYGAAIPIIMGQNIGTCVTAILSSFGANKNAKRAALVHLSFNVIGSSVWLAVFSLIRFILNPVFLNDSASVFGIAIAHSVFNVLCTVLLMPMSGLLEKLVMRLVPDSKIPERNTDLDERLFATPSIALEGSRVVAIKMAESAVNALKTALKCLENYDKALFDEVKREEEQTDIYEDELGSYLVKLSALNISEKDSAQAAMLLKSIGDFERISDHAVEIASASEEINSKKLSFTENAVKELRILSLAVGEILDLTLESFAQVDADVSFKVEPLEQIIDGLCERLRVNHITRLQKGECTISTGFIWADTVTALERTSDHCSNIAGGVIDLSRQNMNIHENLRSFKSNSEEFNEMFEAFGKKYTVNNM